MDSYTDFRFGDSISEYPASGNLIRRENHISLFLSNRHYCPYMHLFLELKQNFFLLPQLAFKFIINIAME